MADTDDGEADASMESSMESLSWPDPSRPIVHYHDHWNVLQVGRLVGDCIFRPTRRRWRMAIAALVTLATVAILLLVLFGVL